MSEKTLTISISESLQIDTEDAPPGKVGAAYALQLAASGGSGTYRFSLALGQTLPAGLTLSDEGLISGTPEQAGDFDVTFVVQSL